MFAVPRPPGNATPRSGWHSLSISAFLIGPAARPPVAQSAGKASTGTCISPAAGAAYVQCRAKFDAEDPRDARLPAAGLQFIGDAMDEQPECTDTTWTVWRMDETGKRFVVRNRLTREAAERLVQEFTARGHKQTYWSGRQQ